MRVIFRIFGHHETRYLHSAGFKKLLVWHAVVADERIREDHDLSRIRRVGEALYVACHAGVEHNFTVRRDSCAEALALEYRAVFEVELHTLQNTPRRGATGEG